MHCNSVVKKAMAHHATLIPIVVYAIAMSIYYDSVFRRVPLTRYAIATNREDASEKDAYRQSYEC